MCNLAHWSAFLGAEGRGLGVKKGVGMCGGGEGVTFFGVEAEQIMCNRASGIGFYS